MVLDCQAGLPEAHEQGTATEAVACFFRASPSPLCSEHVPASDRVHSTLQITWLRDEEAAPQVLKAAAKAMRACGAIESTRATPIPLRPHDARDSYYAGHKLETADSDRYDKVSPR